MTGQGSPRTAWITGAGKGLGRALALRLARDGWVVAASARTAADLRTLAAEAPEGRVRAFPLDITDPEATAATVAAIEAEIGPIDLALLNAGTHIPVSLSDFSAASFRKLLETNVMGTVHGLDALLPGFTARGAGRIAVVASLVGYRGLPTSAAYGASKAALINMCEALRPELAAAGIILMLINPGFVATPLTDRNEFPMPFLISAEAAAEAIVRGLARDSFEIAFPWRFALIMKILRMLPDRLYFTLTRRMIDGS
ncbi:MAG: SDR family NAD(P)-dependent oxidoreductase [Rhodospirillaceae bacterium]